MNIIDKLKKLMLDKELNQAELAKIAGVSEGAVSGWMKGAKPRLSAILKLCSALEIKPNSLQNDSMDLVYDESPNPSIEIIESEVENAFSADDIINSVENLYSCSFDEETRLLLKAINQMGDYEYESAIEYLKKYDNMALATALVMFEKLHKYPRASTDLRTGVHTFSGRESL